MPPSMHNTSAEADSAIADQQISPPAKSPTFMIGDSVIHALTFPELVEIISEAIARNDKRIMAQHNLHSLYMCKVDSVARESYRSYYKVFIDGQPLIWLGRMKGLKLTSENRLTFLDYVKPLMTMATTNGWKVYFVGCAPGVGDQAAETLRNHAPNLQIRTHHGYFDRSVDSPENQKVLADIASFNPQILFVGMGQPLQEKWIAANFDKIQANVMIGVGGGFDYLAGAQRTPPRWTGPLGLEWLHRLYSNPKRLAFRYLVEPWFLVPSIVGDLFSGPRLVASETDESHLPASNPRNPPASGA